MTAGSHRFCTDFRRLDIITVTNSYPIPRIDDCIDQIGLTKFVSKLDLLKGYWQVPLTEHALVPTPGTVLATLNGILYFVA